MNIEEILNKGESQTVEFKKSLHQMKDGCRQLCGMINTDDREGTVFFGICPDKTVCGVNGNLDKAQISLSQHINQKFDPPITPSIKTLGYKQNIIIVLEAKRSKKIPYHEYDGRAFIRVGSETRLLSFEEKQYYSKIRCRDNHQGPWICNKCGTRVMRLESYIIDKNGNFEKSYKCPDCGGEFLPYT